MLCTISFTLSSHHLCLSPRLFAVSVLLMLPLNLTNGKIQKRFQFFQSVSRDSRVYTTVLHFDNHIPCQSSGGGTLYKILYAGAGSAQKGFRYMKEQGFHQWKHMKGLGNLSYRYLVLLKYLEPTYVIPRVLKPFSMNLYQRPVEYLCFKMVFKMVRSWISRRSLFKKDIEQPPHP